MNTTISSGVMRTAASAMATNDIFPAPTRRRFAAGIGAVALSLGASRVAARQGTPPAGAMTVEATQQVLDAYLAALFGGGDFGQYLAEDAVIRMTDTGDAITGRQAIVDAIITWHTVQFDAAPEVTGIVVGAGTAGVEIAFIGTHTDTFAGIPATGIAVDVPYAAFYAFADDLITEIRLYGLVLGILSQLSGAGAGATPAG